MDVGVGEALRDGEMVSKKNIDERELNKPEWAWRRRDVEQMVRKGKQGDQHKSLEGPGGERKKMAGRECG